MSDGSPLLDERPWKRISFLETERAGLEYLPDGSVRVPYRLENGSVARWRRFSPDGRTWWEHGQGLIPFGLETLPAPVRRAKHWLMLAEGESDALALREAFDAVVLGIPGAGTWKPRWARFADGFDVVYVIGDGDRAGRMLNAAVRRDIPHARPVWLPEGEDARAILQRDGARALDPLLAQADQDARLLAAFILGRTIEEAKALLRGEVVRRVA